MLDPPDSIVQDPTVSENAPESTKSDPVTTNDPLTNLTANPAANSDAKIAAETKPGSYDIK